MSLYEAVEKHEWRGAIRAGFVFTTQTFAVKRKSSDAAFVFTRDTRFHAQGQCSQYTTTGRAAELMCLYKNSLVTERSRIHFCLGKYHPRIKNSVRKIHELPRKHVLRTTRISILSACLRIYDTLCGYSGAERGYPPQVQNKTQCNALAH